LHVFSNDSLFPSRSLEEGEIVDACARSQTVDMFKKFLFFLGHGN